MLRLNTRHEEQKGHEPWPGLDRQPPGSRDSRDASSAGRLGGTTGSEPEKKKEGPGLISVKRTTGISAGQESSY